jgi:hypothetical protein
MSSDDDACDFALGALRSTQRDLVARRRLYHRELDRRISALERSLSGLVPFESDSALPAELWEKLCDLCTRQGSYDTGGSFDCLAGRWEHHGEGIETKALWSDKTLLIRCEPGASEEGHPQPDEEDEHVIVIAGDLVIGGRVLRTGDYLHIPVGAFHPQMHTRHGCLLFTQYVAR